MRHEGISCLLGMGQERISCLLGIGSWDGDPAVASGPLEMRRVWHPMRDAVIGVQERVGSLAACFQNRQGRARKRLEEVADIF